MIYIVEENGIKKRYIIPENARIATEEDLEYFQRQANQALLKREQNIEIANFRDEIAKRQREIVELKKSLASTDYKLYKYLEGELDGAEFEPIKQNRKQWRKQINDLEAEIKVISDKIEEIKQLWN